MPEIQANSVDTATLAVAFLYALAQAVWLLWHRRPPKSWLSRFGVDFFSGVSLFPLMLLIGCPFFPAARVALGSVGNVTLCSAGVVALLAVLQNAFE